MLSKPDDGEIAQNLRGFLGGLVVLAESVRQPRVGIRADIGVRDARQLLDIRPQLPRAQRAVQSDRQGLRMPDRIPESLGRSARTACGPRHR